MMADTGSGRIDITTAAFCTVCGSRSLRRATWGKRCNLLRNDLTRCPGILATGAAS